MFGKKRRYSSTLHAHAPGPVAPWPLAHRGCCPWCSSRPPIIQRAVTPRPWLGCTAHSPPLFTSWCSLHGPGPRRRR